MRHRKADVGEDFVFLLENLSEAQFRLVEYLARTNGRVVPSKVEGFGRATFEVVSDSRPSTFAFKGTVGSLWWRGWLSKVGEEYVLSDRARVAVLAQLEVAS